MFQNGPLRAPSGPQTSFATEQIIDMLAERQAWIRSSSA